MDDKNKHTELFFLTFKNICRLIYSPIWIRQTVVLDTYIPRSPVASSQPAEINYSIHFIFIRTEYGKVRSPSFCTYFRLSFTLKHILLYCRYIKWSRRPRIKDGIKREIKNMTSVKGTQVSERNTAHNKIRNIMFYKERGRQDG